MLSYLPPPPSDVGGAAPALVTRHNPHANTPVRGSSGWLAAPQGPAAPPGDKCGGTRARGHAGMLQTLSYWVCVCVCVCVCVSSSFPARVKNGRIHLTSSLKALHVVFSFCLPLANPRLLAISQPACSHEASRFLLVQQQLPCCLFLLLSILIIIWYG